METSNTLLNLEQQTVFNRYFETNGNLHTFMANNIYVVISEYKIRKDTEVVLEIVSNNTVITMWKQIDLIHINIY